MALFNMNEAAVNARRLLDAFRKWRLPVIHVQHFSVRPGSTFFLPESDGVEINDLVAPEKEETIVHKHYPNSFRETDLLDVLKDNEIEKLTVCGAMSHMCVDATVRAAYDYGFKVSIAEDACATRDLMFKEISVKATHVHASFMAALSSPYAEVVTTEEIIDRPAQ